MLIKQRDEIKPSEITDESSYFRRRRFIKGVIKSGVAGMLIANFPAPVLASEDKHYRKLNNVIPGPYSTDEKLTSFEDVTHYNNFYEFGTEKTDPAEYSGAFKPRPWSVAVAGECEKPGVFNLEDFISPYQLQERIYRLRCVEAWSMVIPWVGFPLGPVLKRFKPTSRAKYVAFTTVLRPSQMPGQQRSVLEWPYVEGLRIDEAMNPLTMMVVGLYGMVLPNQNGAPLRLVVPWKYGYKSIKSIVKIAFTESQPPTTWNRYAPNEYGFYSNVNPNVDHPRWSQRRERRIGEFRKRDTLMFNGYGKQVASMYKGMDLKKYH